MRNTLPTRGPYYYESAIANFDDETGPDIHWVTYQKRGNDVVCFDSSGDLQHLDLVKYLRVESIK